MNGVWLSMVLIGVLTFLTRLSFILLFSRWQPPEIIRRGLRFVPVSVLTAIFIPELLLVDGGLSFTAANPRLIAGAAAILIAWKTKSALWSIAAGLAVFWFSLQYL